MKNKKKKRLLDAQRYSNDVNAARAFLSKTSYTLMFVAHETGLSYWWLARFVRGEITDPKVSKLAALLRFMEKE